MSEANISVDPLVGFPVGTIVSVPFALGTATVRILSTLKLRRSVIHHVEDIATGHQDYVGPEWMKPTRR